MTDITGDIDIRKEVPADSLYTSTLAGFTTSSLPVKGEHRLPHALDSSILGLSIKITDIIKNLYIGGRVASRCSSNWFLRNIYYLRDGLQVFNTIALSFIALIPKLRTSGLIKNLINQRRLTRTRNASNNLL